jgi:ferredoxin-type protein NapH
MADLGTVSTASGRPSPLGWGKTLAWAVPMMLLTALLMAGGPNRPTDSARLVPLVTVWLFANYLFLRMVRSAKTDRYRAPYFIAIAFGFVLNFVPNLLELRGNMAVTDEDMLLGQTPFCHIVIPMTLIPAALTRTIIFPGSILGQFAGIASMLALWIGFSLALGRGWCSWGCFFGGLDEFFARLAKRPLIRHIAQRWTYLPYAVLAVVIVTAAWSLSPTYCIWLCPFKTVTEYPQVDSLTRALQAVIFLSLFAGLVVVLPLLTKRRTQCGLFCPFGAFQSAANWLNAVTVRVNRETCQDCGRCARDCAQFALHTDALRLGRPDLSCSKCGKCVDECPTGAIHFQVRGSGTGASAGAARMLYIFPSFLFMAVFGAGMIQGGLHRVLLLATTGSMIK